MCSFRRGVVASGTLLPALLVLALAGCDGEHSGPEQGASSSDASVAAGPADAEAATLEAEGRWTEAAARYRERALAGEPPESGAAIRQALAAYFMADRPDDARKLAVEIRERWPAYHEVLFYLADLERVTMRYEAARRSIESFLELEPEHVQGNLVAGLVLVALGEAESGLGSIEKYLRHPDADTERRAEAEVVRVRALRGLGRHREAADAITEVLEARPLDPVALAEAAQSYALGESEILSRAASHEHGWLSRRGHRLTVQDPDSLHETAPRPEGRARLALQARDRREFLAAIKELGSLLGAEPRSPRLAYLLGQLWLRLGRYRECGEVLDAYAKTGAALNPDLLHLRALLFDRQGMAREAEAEWRRAAGSMETRGATGDESGSVEPPAVILQAAADHLLETDGDLELASRWYAAAARGSPVTPEPIAGEIRIAIRKGDLERARSLLGELATRVDVKTDEDYERLDATIQGLRGDLRLAARRLTPLIVESPSEDRNFAAFLRVFGEQRGVPEVERIRRLRDEWSAKRRAVDDARRSLSARPLEECAGDYHRLGLLHMETRDRESALDAFMLAAELDPQSAESLRAALKVLRRPSDVFVRLHSMRRILQRDPGDAETLELLARTYLQLGVRPGEAEGIATRLVKLRPGPASEQLLEEARAAPR